LGSLLAIPFPSWLKPEIIPGLPFRWYGLMYLVAFGTAYFVYRKQVRERNFPMTEDDLSGLFFWGILSLLVGARLFAALIYETSDLYRKNPALVFWPFRNGKFTGLQGMSYHGGVIGGILSIFIYSKVKGFDYREIGDMYAASIPLGYTFGRLGNFINGELFGRITPVPWGMIFPQGGISPGDSRWQAVRDWAARRGFSGLEGLINLPRHPSQLYEALFEGLVLWAFIWFFRNRKPFKGFLLALYPMGYGVIRFILEYFREPDTDLGYPIQLVKPALPPDLEHPLLCFSMGQILCVGMILLGLLWLLIFSRLPNREPVRVYPVGGIAPGLGRTQEEKNQNRNSGRKLRKKLQKGR